MSRIGDVAIDAAISSVASKTTTGAGVVGFVGFMASINWLGVSGVFIAVMGLLVNLCFQRRRDSRDRDRHKWECEEHQARMAAIQGERKC